MLTIYMPRVNPDDIKSMIIKYYTPFKTNILFYWFV